MGAKKQKVPDDIVDLFLGDSEGESAHLDEKTVPITKKLDSPLAPETDFTKSVKTGLSGVKSPSSVNSASEKRVSAVASSSVENFLRGGDHLRLAQERISQLENELDRLMKENERLAAAAETFKRLKEEFQGQLERFQLDRENEKTIHSQEAKILKERLVAKEKEGQEARRKIEEMELRLDSSLGKIKKREKDLEHRLEILKIEGGALAKSKDETILTLKRKIDHLETQAETHFKKNQSHYKKLQNKEESIRRVVKALRLALAQLDDSEEESEMYKKVE